MAERTLATVEVIHKITPIPKADMIEVAHVLGWEVVVRKAENLKVGDKVVYVEVDSILPEKLLKLISMWDDSKNKGNLNGSMGNRLRTRKFRGTISQGMIIPLKVLIENY